MSLADYAQMYALLAWLIPTLCGLFVIGICFWVSRDRVPRSARRKRGF